MNDIPISPTPSRNPIRTTILIVVLLLVGFLFGTSYDRQRGTINLRRLTERFSGDGRVVDETYDLIQQKFVNRPIPVDALVRGAAAGMVRSLGDEYSFYLAPSEAKQFANELNGKFDGIGAELGLKDGHVVIIAPLPDTPAARAGLRTNDIIVAVDDKSTDGQTLDQVVRSIRGKEGTTVAITYQRADQEEKSVTLTRARISVKSVKGSFEQTPNGTTVAVVRITSFTDTTNREFSDFAQEILLKRPRGIVFDLRGNPGGYLDTALNVADTFLTDGPMVVEEYGSGERKTMQADKDALITGFPVEVLIDGGTASAAEILAGALHDRLQSRLIGEKTFGKGSVQELEDLPDGSMVKLTVAHWLTPNGTKVDGVGLSPDIPVAAGEPDGTDPQLLRAYEELQRTTP